VSLLRRGIYLALTGISAEEGNPRPDGYLCGRGEYLALTGISAEEGNTPP